MAVNRDAWGPIKDPQSLADLPAGQAVKEIRVAARDDTYGRGPEDWWRFLPNYGDRKLPAAAAILEWLRGQANHHRMAPEPGPQIAAAVDAATEDWHRHGEIWTAIRAARAIFERHYPQ